MEDDEVVFLQQQSDNSTPQQGNARGVAWLQQQQVTDRQPVAACVQLQQNAYHVALAIHKCKSGGNHVLCYSDTRKQVLSIPYRVIAELAVQCCDHPRPLWLQKQAGVYRSDEVLLYNAVTSLRALAWIQKQARNMVQQYVRPEHAS